MTYEVRFTPSAFRDLSRLSSSLQQRIDKRLVALTEDPRPRGCKKLAGKAEHYRIRVGDYRVIYEVQDKVLLVLVLKMGHRRRVHR
jgi:mRNA interferase RelE/StbE